MSKNLLDGDGKFLGTLSELREVNAGTPGARAGYDTGGFSGYYWTPEDAAQYSSATQFGTNLGKGAGGFFAILTIGFFVAAWYMNLAAYRSFKTKRFGRGLLFFTMVNSLALAVLAMGIIYILILIFPAITEITVLGYIIGGIFIFASMIMPVAYIFIALINLYLVFVKEVHLH